MRHFLFEDKEYKINPQFRRRRIKDDSARALLSLMRTIGRNAGKHGGNFGDSRGGGVPRSTGRMRGSGSADARQKCVVKMQYSNSGAAHQVQLEKYLIREGTDVEGGQAKLYGSDSEEYRQNMDDRNFRIFLSPQSKQVDLTDLSKKFMGKLEAATGYKLYWQAANHYNTACPHAHLLINGVDKSGKQVEIPKDIVKVFMREFARDICTSQLGNRTQEEIAIEKEKELTAPRYTRLDDRILDLSEGTQRLNLDGAKDSRERDRLLARIETLRSMKLCVYKDGGYNLLPRWDEDLKANGRYNTFLNARTELNYSRPESMRVFSGEQKEAVGKVTKVYRTDGDASDNHAVIIESFDGKAHFVPLFKEPEIKDGEQKRRLQVGELVTIKTYQNQKGRLTPYISKLAVAQAQKEIRAKNYSGILAAEVLARQVDRIQKS